ncbi:MAG: DsbA family protein [Spirochaetota bacterium]
MYIWSRYRAQQLEIHSTPYFYINGHPVDGVVPYDVFCLLIDKELSK